MNQRLLPRTLPVLLACAFSGAASASGFQLLEQNASGLGNAYAGSAAVAEDASTIFYNPAGMTLLEGRQVSLGFVAVSPNFQFNNSGSRNPTVLQGPLLGLPAAAAGPTGDAGHMGVLPNAYISWPVSKGVTLGLGLGAPFGLMTEYTPGWAGQYQSNKFDIKTMNVNPSIAWRATDKLSLGFGLDWQKISAEYVKRTPVTVVPGVVYIDGLAAISLDNNAWGWNAGALYKLSDTMRVGLSYRSDITQKATGTVSLAPSIGLPVTGTARADVRLPATWVLSTHQVLNDRWEMMGDISRTQWSSIQQLVIRTSLSANPDILDLQFRNTWRVAFGGTYKYSDAWKFRFGVAWDQTPVPDDAHRPASMPDNNRWWLSMGAQFRPSADATLDVGYAHLFVKDPTILNNGSGNAAAKGLISGTYSDSANVLGVQYSQKF